MEVSLKRLFGLEVLLFYYFKWLLLLLDMFHLITKYLFGNEEQHEEQNPGRTPEEQSPGRTPEDQNTGRQKNRTQEGHQKIRTQDARRTEPR